MNYTTDVPIESTESTLGNNETIIKKEIDSITIESLDQQAMFNKTIYFTYNVNGYKAAIFLTKYPTNNCQLSSLGEARRLIYILKEQKELLNKLMTTLRSLSNPQILIDVPQCEFDEVMIRLTDYMEIIFTQPYISTNRTPMKIALLRWKI